MQLAKPSEPSKNPQTRPQPPAMHTTPPSNTPITTPWVFRETGSSCPTGNPLPGREWQANPPKRGGGGDVKQALRPCRDYLWPVSSAAPGHGRFLWEPGSWEGREGRKTATPALDERREEDCGKGGTPQQPPGLGSRECESGKSRSAPAAQPGSSALPAPKGSTGVRGRVLQGALLHQRDAKGGVLPVYEPFYTPRAVCTTLM